MFAVALQHDGKIVVVGSDCGGNFRSPFIVARFTNRGSIDRGFGNGGKVTTVLGLDSRASAVAIRADGKIVVAGTVALANSRPRLGLARYLASGELDPNFGTEGTVLSDFAGSSPALLIQPDGRIVVACGLEGPRRFGVARYDVDGAVDPTFGEDGEVRTQFRAGSAAQAVARQRDGKIVAAGGAGGDFAVARYTAVGTLDQSFGGDGRVTTPLGPEWRRRGGH